MPLSGQGVCSTLNRFQCPVPPRTSFAVNLHNIEEMSASRAEL